EFVPGVGNRDFPFPGSLILPKFRPNDPRREFVDSISYGEKNNGGGPRGSGPFSGGTERVRPVFRDTSILHDASRYPRSRRSARRAVVGRVLLGRAESPSVRPADEGRETRALQHNWRATRRPWRRRRAARHSSPVSHAFWLRSVE